MKSILIGLFLPLISGCAGLAVGSFAKYESISEDVVLSDYDSKVVRPRIGVSTENKLSKEVLIETWGVPDRTQEQGKCKVFSYHDGYTWAGVGAFVLVLPIPLGIPTGKAEKHFYFAGDELVGYVSEGTDINSMFGYMCGSNECKFNFGATNQDKFRTKRIDQCSG